MEYHRLFFIVFIAIVVVIANAQKPDDKPKDSSVCKLPVERGPCRALKKNWTYDSTEQKCKEFVYGGCRGNDNNFKTEAECRSVCGIKN